MSVVPISTRRPRQNGTIRPRPPLTTVPSDSTNGASPVPASAPPPRSNQAIASERSQPGRTSGRPRTGLFLASAVIFLVVAELLLTLIPILRVIAWGIGLV